MARFVLGKPLAHKYMVARISTHWQRRFLGFVFLAALMVSARAQTTDVPVVSIEATRPDTSEPSPSARITPGQFTLRRTGPTNTALTVQVTFGGTATMGLDYERTSNTVEFGRGEAARTVEIFAGSDELFEGDETVVAQLPRSPAGAYVVIAEKSRALVTIHDDDVAPVTGVEITEPRDGETVIFGTAVTVKATAVDVDGYIARLEFFDNNVSIGVSQINFFQAPTNGTPIYHEIQWKVGTPEKHVLTAVGISSNGEKVVSKAVTVAAARAPVTNIEITEPRDGETVIYGSTNVVKATAVDVDGYIARLEFFANDVSIGVSEINFFQAPTNGTPIYHEVQWKVEAPGEHVLTAVGVSSNGEKVVSKPVKVMAGRLALTRCVRDADGRVQLQLRGVPGQRGVLQRSSDLSRWEDVTNVDLPDGTVEFTDENSGAASQYYRLRLR